MAPDLIVGYIGKHIAVRSYPSFGIQLSVFSSPRPSPPDHRSEQLSEMLHEKERLPVLSGEVWFEQVGRLSRFPYSRSNRSSSDEDSLQKAPKSPPTPRDYHIEVLQIDPQHCVYSLIHEHVNLLMRFTR